MNTLDCGSCRISLRPEAEELVDRMCPVVSGKVVSNLGKVGIDANSDMAHGRDFLAKVIDYSGVMQLAEEACETRLLQLESTQKGYQPVEY